MNNFKTTEEQSLLRLLLKEYFRKYTVGVLALEIVAVAIGSLLPIMQKKLIDGVGSGSGRIVYYSIAFIAVLLGCQFFCRAGGRFLRGVLSVKVRTELKSSVFKHLLNLPEDFLRSRGAGYFFNRLQNDIGEISAFVANNGLLIPAEIVKLFCALLIMTFLQWHCAVLAVPFLIMQSVICYWFRNRQYKLARELQECTASERHVMQEYLANHAMVKTHNIDCGAAERIDRGLSHWGGLMRSRLNNEGVFSACLQIPVWLCGGLILLSGVYMVMHKQSTLGEVWALLALMNLIFAPSRLLGTIFVQLQSSVAAWHRVQELSSHAVECDCGGSEVVYLRGDLEFRNVEFAYSADRKILNELNLIVPYGRGVFLCGANGSGKSTLFSLLLRLYTPQAGTILLGGKLINDFPLKAYRLRIGYIGQHPEFIRGTLRENLLLGNEPHTDEQIMDIFRQLQCEYLVDRLPDKLAAQVAERGENFSGGERLRLALVRELLRDTDWLLFDEAAANLDMIGRQQFYELLQRLPGNKGVIAIVHDLPENSSWPVLQIENLQNMQ